MMPCPPFEEISAFSDGLLSADRQAAVQQHLADCPACAVELSRLSAMSRLLQGSLPAGISQIARRRLHDNIDAAMERGLVRLGWSLSGVAAAVLLVGSAMLVQLGGSSSASAQAAPPWLGVARSAEAESVVRDARTPAAAIYLADASGTGSSSSSVDVP
jgi:anti-sigma factor RsiW